MYVSTVAKMAAVGTFWLITLGGAFYYGGRNEKLNNVELKAMAEEAGKAAQKGAAIEIAKIRVRNTTIKGRVETIVRDNPVYRDCSHDDATLGLLNDAILGRKPSDSSVPRAVSPQR